MSTPSIRLEISKIYSSPLIESASLGAEDNLYGFEGGTVIQHEREYHLFTAERFGDPELVKLRLAQWRSRDGLSWVRISTLFESSAEFTGKDPRASLWSPMPFFNDDENRWNLFYVAYRSKPNDPTGWYLNHGGRIYRAVSQVPGKGGLGGPYQDIDVILEPGVHSDHWEGLQGVDSFYLYRAQGAWFGFYGSAKTEQTPMTGWAVGLATAPYMAGPWKRCSERNPIKMDESFAENPIVSQLADGTYIAMLDGQNRIGYSTSPDGLAWSQATFLKMPPSAVWWDVLRTPLCLLPLSDDGSFAIFFTAITSRRFGGLGRVDVVLEYT